MDPAKCVLLPILLLLLIFLGHHSCIAAENATIDTAESIHIIKDGQPLVSTNKQFALGFFSFGNSTTRRYVGVWYYNIPDFTVLWVANRNQPLIDMSGTLAIDPHGNIVIYSTAKNISLWSTNVSLSTNNDMSFKLLGTGNLVVVQQESQKILWQSFDYPSHTMPSYMKIGLDRRTGFSRFLTSWKAKDDPGTGNFTCRIDTTGYPQLVVYRGNVPWWRGGLWTGRRWSGVPEMTRSFVINTSFIDNADEISLSNGVKVDTLLSRLVLDESGSLHRSIWQDHDRKWLEFYSAPTEWCDTYNRCGPNTNCNPYMLDQWQCQCLPGFEPKSPRDWSLTEAWDGCIRRKENVTCRRGEGFVKVARVKTPDTSTARADKGMSLEACKEACLKDCNCTAYTSANETSGTGCVTWYGDVIDTRTYANVGQDLYVRVDAQVLAEYARNSKQSAKKEVEIIVPIVAILLLLLLLLASLLYLRQKRRERSKRLFGLVDSPNQNELLDQTKTTTSDLPAFDLNTIAKATDNFSVHNKLGQGGFGSVYKGKLKSGEEIAVKRLAKNSGQGVGEFKNEVRLIAKLQHRNLVRILGYCVQHDEKMLVYEYLSNKSLDSLIFDEGKKALLNWAKRLEIINGIARGILYLHQDSRLKIIHRDLKASNVLLDADLNPKIADFGMARTFGKDQMQANTNRIVGTYGYMSPEYAMGGLFSVKSDVYSFGVLLLEIITGRKNSSYGDDSSYLNLVGHVWELWKEERAMEIVDSTLDESSCGNEIMRCIQIGLLCVQEDSTDRPIMSTVVFMLGNEMALPSPKKPAFILQRKCNSGDPSTSSAGTITMIDAR